MEHVKCPICEIDDTRLLVRKNAFNIVRCVRCGLVYVNPRYDERELVEFYNRPAAPEDPASDNIRKSHDDHKVRKFRLSIELLKRQSRPVSKVFDLGCSTGIFLDMAASEGWKPYGTDLNRRLVNENRKRFGDAVSVQDGERIDFPDDSFDAVTLFDVIEHLRDPVSALREAGRVTAPGGFVVLSTPNAAGLFPRITYALFGKTIGAWEHPTPPGHIYQFSPDTLRRTAEKAGLEFADDCNFEIHPPYTVGELENSIVNALRKSGSSAAAAETSQAAATATSPVGPTGRAYSIKKLPRLMIRLLSGCLVWFLYPVARMLGSGDSMIMVFRKVPATGNHAAG
ncbi:MAG: class I SAM-dependent methyltransferase [Nitrospirae bacterium]|nr:class I SAM-dependent methyltransferase [Nitrospirota bacterium]